jgi:hypothetical protein
MDSNTQIVNINNFVSTFLETQKDGLKTETLLEEWNSDEVQSALSAVVAKAMKKVSRKRKKDKNKPKRGSSAYIIFCGEHRPVVANDNPDMSAKEIVRELGACWTRLKLADKDEITRLNGLAEIDKERYLKEMETYEPPADDGDDDDDKTKKTKKKKQAGPKRCKSAYLFFCEKERKSIKEDDPALQPKEVTTKLGEAWQELKKDEDRADEMSVFTDLADEDKARYIEEKENWENIDGEDEEKPKKAAPKKAAPKKAAPKKAAPKKAAPKKAAPKKAAPKKAAPKKAAPKKAAPKKAAPKKAAPKKAAPKKAAPKKAAPKKAAPKKAAPKKAAPKKAEDEELLEEDDELVEEDEELVEEDEELVEDTKPKKVSVKKSTGKKKASVKKSGGKKMTGYVMFSKYFRKKTEDETPGLKGAIVTKALAAAWRDLGTDGKEEWKDKAKDL